MVPNLVFQIVHWIGDKAIIQMYFYVDEGKVKREVEAMNERLSKRGIVDERYVYIPLSRG